MNQLQVIQRDGKFLVDSREVAVMIDKRHDHLLRDIVGYCQILEKSTDPKIGVSDFFEESTYRDSTGRILRKYDLTRKGCEMVANKMTGERGVLFTAAYVTKFEEMEKQQTSLVGLTPELQAIIMLDKRSQEFDQRITKIENNSTVDYGQQRTLSKLGNRVALRILGGKDSAAYRNKSLRSKVYSQLWNDFKDYFQVNSYSNTLIKDYDQAIDYINGWSLFGGLLREVEETNKQIVF